MEERNEILAKVSKRGVSLKRVQADCKDDREIVLAAVCEDGYALQHASTRLKNDPEIVLAAVTRNRWALKYASDELKNDREIVLAAVRKFGGALRFASNRLQNDTEIVRAAVSNYGLALQYASEELRNNKDIALAAVKSSSYAFAHVSAELRGDVDVVAAAVGSGRDEQEIRMIFRHVSFGVKEKLRKLSSMRKDPDGLLHAQERDDPRHVEAFVATEVPAETCRLNFLRAVQQHVDVPEEAMKSILEYDGSEERLKELRLLEELLPIIVAYGDSVDSLLRAAN